MFTRFMLLILVTSNLIIIGLTILACQYVARNQVYDMELIRSQYAHSVKRYYQRGCLDGTDYPPEWRKPTTDFNIRSVPRYCDGMLEVQQFEIEKDITSLGRARYE